MRTNSKKRQVLVSYLSSVLNNLSSEGRRLVENTAGANDELQKIRDVFNNEWYFALSEYDEEVDGSSSEADREEALSKLQIAWAAAILAAMARSYRRGYGSRGRQDSSSLTLDKITKSDPMFKKIVDKHTSFANQFAKQYSDGLTDRRGAMGVGARTNMYGQALKSAYNAGAVFGGINDGKIWWRLGACEHCPDCVALASSGPYSTKTLPTLPGNGDTLCKTNCCCHLVFVRGQKQQGPDDTLSSWILAGDSGNVEEAEGDDAVVRKIQDMMLRRSYLRRASLGSDDITKSDVEAANAEAAGINRDIDAIASDNSMAAVVRYNPASIITQADISQRDVDDIFLDGIDGPSIFRAQIDGAIKEVDRLTKLFDRMPARSSVVPKVKRDPNMEPKIGSFSTYNVVGNGAAKTFIIVRKILEILNQTEIFVEVGALGEKMERVVGFSGMWIRGQRNEVNMLLSMLDESKTEFAAGEVMFL